MIFDAKKLKKLNNPERSEWIPVNGLWETLGLDDPGILVDLGAGTGFFTAPLAALAPETRIYALDVQQEMISYMEEKMPENVVPLLIDGRKIPLEENSVDGLLCINVYHEIPDRPAMLKEIRRILKPDGVLLLLDWEKESPVLKDGPPLERRIPAALMVEELVEAGFHGIESFYRFNSHTALRGVKPL